MSVLASLIQVVILLFGKTMLLTALPVDIQGHLSLPIEKPISALTSGASIQIDVSSMITYNQGDDIVKFRKKLTDLVPPNSIKATLPSDKGDKIILKYDGSNMFNKKQVLISLYNDSGVPSKTDFSKVEIDSKIMLKDVKVFWKNHKK